MSSIGASNPEYVNARVRARRAALLSDEDYRKLIRMGPDGIARFMEETEYETEINALGARYSGTDLIEYALNRNLAKHFHDMLDWSEGRLNDLIARYLRKYDTWNIKTVIRGVYSDASAEAIQSDLILAGELEPEFLDRLSELETIEAVVEQLDETLYGDALADALDEFEDDGVLVPLENAVDREFYTHLLDDLPTGWSEGPIGRYVEFLQAEIDFLNARNALRLARSGADLDPAAYFIEGGTLFTPGDLRSLATNTDQLITHIRESKYGDDLSIALDELEEADTLIQFEHALDAALLEYTDRLSTVYPVSITAVMSYILAKEREVENIRAIARGREVGLDEAEIEEELVIL
jgi:V/A-type H+-transporting ATPase subunit C